MTNLNTALQKLCVACQHVPHITYISLFFLLSVISADLYAQEADVLTAVGALMQNGMTLAATGSGALVVLVAIGVIIYSLVQVYRERHTIGEVAIRIIAAIVVALVVGLLVTLAITNIAAVATTSG